jgi:hypothetical protein
MGERNTTQTFKSLLKRPDIFGWNDPEQTTEVCCENVQSFQDPKKGE